MLPQVQLQPQSLKNYKGLVSAELLTEIEELGRNLKDVKVNMVNATPRGGGVAEILKSLTPLLRDVGLNANWYTIPPREDFFEVTKKMHNALQGQDYDFPFSARRRYLYHMAATAKLMRDMGADIWVVHDPQPAGVIAYLPHFHPAVSHIHIDLTDPNLEVWYFLAGFLIAYDRVIVSAEDFVKPEIRSKTIVFPPAIDPLMPKNQPLPFIRAKQILEGFGIKPDWPLIAQVSRFDPWKDPIGVITAYRLAKKKIPKLQLALVGIMLAQDDPEAIRVYRKVAREAAKDKDIFLFADVGMLGSLKVDTFVNAVQVAADVIVQNSIREGFGLVVAEAMWKEKPVIGGKAAGIRCQIKDEQNGLLANSPREMAKHIARLIADSGLRNTLGRNAKESVRQKFLMPRLVCDYLKVFNSILFTHANQKRKKITAKKFRRRCAPT